MSIHKNLSIALHELKMLKLTGDDIHSPFENYALELVEQLANHFDRILATTHAHNISGELLSLYVDGVRFIRDPMQNVFPVGQPAAAVQIGAAANAISLMAEAH